MSEACRGKIATRPTPEEPLVASACRVDSGRLWDDMDLSLAATRIVTGDTRCRFSTEAGDCPCRETVGAMHVGCGLMGHGTDMPV